MDLSTLFLQGAFFMSKNRQGEIMSTSAQIVLIIGAVITAIFAITGFAPNFKNDRKDKEDKK